MRTARPSTVVGLVVALLQACAAPAPSIVALDQPLPDLSFEGPEGATSLSALTETEKGSAHLLLVRVVTGWCGPCQWHAANTASTIPEELKDRVRVLDVVLAGEDNGPPVAADVAAWALRSGGAATVVADPSFKLAPLFPSRVALPLATVIDTRTLTPLSALSNPDPDTLSDALREAVARVDGTRVDGVRSPGVSSRPLVDDRFTRDQWAMISAMALTTAPVDPTNAHESDVAAIAFGKALFFDADLSPSSKRVSCGTCHVPDLLFQDGKDQPAEGVGSVPRNVPTVILAADQRWLFWDGRADSPWAQAIMPIEAPNEMGSSRLFAAHVIRTKYQTTYEAIFGALPPLGDLARFPPTGKPGDPAWEAMTPGDRTQVNRVFSDVGKALAAYEHSLRPLPNAFDRYAQGALDALTSAEKDGLAAFFSAGCVQCHHGPRLTDDSFHALRFPTGRPDRTADPGRSEGISELLASEFRRSGAFSDAPTTEVAPRAGPGLLGAFKTPGLRGVPYTLPYGHGGSFGGLTSTISAHRTGGLGVESPYAVGVSEPWLIAFDAALTPRIIAFLQTLRVELAP